jgi:uncharacterized repeat protein (TIGR01451 family)/LPXTG-motif cell wall-anchored protein
MRTRLLRARRFGRAPKASAGAARTPAVPRLLLACGVLSATIVGPVPGGRPALADPGDATPGISKSGAPEQTTPDGTITYTINYTCSNNNNTPPVDGCDGAVITDPLPTFMNIYGQTVPVEFVSASGSGVFPDVTLGPDGVVRAAAGTWNPGVSGAITITVRVPRGVLPVGTTTLSNIATVTDPEDGFTDDTDPVVTTVTVAEPDWSITKLGPGTNTRMDREYDWVVSVCGPSTSALWPVFEISDTLPPGFEFVAAEHGGTYDDDPTGADPIDSVSDGAGTVRWRFDDTNNPPPLVDDSTAGRGCFRTTVTGRFPSGYVSPLPGADHPNDDNVADAHKLNLVTGTGSNDAGDTEDLGTDDWESVLVAPTFGDAGIGKRFTDVAGADNFYATTGDVGAFNLSATFDSDFPVDYAVLTDGRWAFDDGGTSDSGPGMPESFEPTAAIPGTWTGGIAAQLQWSADGTTWTDLGAPVLSGAAEIALPAGARHVRWFWGTPGGDDVIPRDFEAEGQRIIGNLGSPENDFGLYTNVAQLHVERDGVSLADLEDADQYILETPAPLASIAKAAQHGTRLPGQETTYTIAVGNDADATGPLTDPEVIDCVPQFLAVVAGPTAGAGWTVDPSPAPCQTEGPDGTLQPGTPLHLTYSGTLQPGDDAPPITYSVRVSPSDPGPVAPFGTYINTAFVTPAGGGTFGHCANTDPVCGSAVSIVVPPTVEMASRKCVSGALDTGVFRPNPDCEGANPPQTIAQTLPGNEILWRLELENVGNTPASNIDFIDIFPHVGDRAVITTTQGVLNPRGSEFTPYLVSPIAAPPGWTVSYSTSADPCRPEVGGPTSGCEAPNWTTTPDLAAITTYRSIKLHYDDVLAFGESATFTWEMRAPVDDATYDVNGDEADDTYEFLDDTDGNCGAYVPASDPTHCPRAVNSFAYGADATGFGPGIPPPARLFAEPPQVEVRVSDPPPPHAIGDRVWFDRNFDGIQSTNLTDEPGIGGIFVELLDAGGTVIDSTYTDPNGDYLFTNGGLGLDTGTYRVRFHKPTGWWVSPPNQTGDPSGADQDGANTNDDSDVPQSGTDETGGTYHDTAPVTLGDPLNPTVDDEIDLTWDMGLWRPLPGIDLVKVTKDDAWPLSAAGDGVVILRGRPVEWIYTIGNTGNTRLDGVTLSDDELPSAVFTCVALDPVTGVEGAAVTLPATLLRGEQLRCRTPGTAQSTNYDNTGTVVGTVVTDDGQPAGPGPDGFPPSPATVTDTDPSSYISGKYDLALAKTLGTVDLAAGTATFTITVRNEGTVSSGAYTVTDVLPDGLTLLPTTSPAPVSALPQPDGSTVIEWDRSGLAPNTNHTFTVRARIDDYAERPYRNYAEISADSAELVTTGGVPTPAPNGDWDSDPDADITNDSTDYGPTGTPNAAADNTTITQAGSLGFPEAGDDPADGQDDADIADLNPTITYDLALAKVAQPTDIALGQNPTFVVRVYNQGNVPSGPVVVRDQLPSGLTFVDAAPSTPECTPATGNQVVCGIASIQPGAFAELTITATIDTVNGAPDYSSAPWRNWAEIHSDSAEIYSAPSDVVTDEDSQPEGVENGGDGNGVGRDDTLPGDPYADVPTAGAQYAAPIGPDEDDNDDATLTSSVRYDLALAKTAGAVDHATGEVAFTVTVANQGTVASGPYSVSDWLPPGVVLVGGTANPPTSATTAATLSWTDLPSLDPGATQTITFTVRVTDFTVHSFRNLAEITDDSAAELYNLADIDSVPDSVTTNDAPAPGGYDTPGVDNTGPDAIAQAGVLPDTSDDADIADVVLDIDYDLALAKVADTPTVALGENPVFQVRVYNQGNVQSGAVVVRDQLPTGLSFDPAASTAGCVTTPGNQVLCTIDNIGPGGSEPLTIATTIDGAPDDYGTAPWVNWAEIDSDEAAETYAVADADSTPEGGATGNGVGADATPPGDQFDDVTSAGDQYASPAAADEDDNDRGEVTTSVRYDLALAKVVDATDVAERLPDPVITYTMTVGNQGTVPSGEYTVTDLLPAGVEFVSATAGGQLDPVNPRLVTWTGTDLAPGATATFTVDARIVDFTLRPYRNHAEISDDSADELYGIADADSVPDADPTNDNEGNGISDFGYGPVGASDPDADNLDLSDAGQLDDGDDDADVADVSLPLTDAYDLALAKVVDQAVIAYDGTITYTITVQNQGLVASREFTVTDWVPGGLQALDASSGGVVDDAAGTVSWTVANLLPGESTTLTFTARIGDINQRPFRNVAEITDDSADYYTIDGEPVEDHDSDPDTDTSNDGDYDVAGVDNVDDQNGDAIDKAGAAPDPEDDADIADVSVDVRYDLALIKTGPATMDPTGEVTFTVTVVNQGTVPSNEFTVVDVIPAGMAFASASNGGIDDGAGNVVWANLANLDPGSSVQLAVTFTITDLTQRPFTNVAEITDDSSGHYSSGTETVTDDDSFPGDADTSLADNTSVDEAGAPGEPSDEGFDDEDVAVVSTEIRYDMELAKTVSGGPVTLGSPATYTITVFNNGNVPSGPVTVVDTLPAGLTAGAISNGGVLNPDGTITWVVELAPGQQLALTVAVTVTDITQRPFRNVADITADGADLYDQPGGDVEDIDSVPGDPDTSQADNTSIDDAGDGADAGFDDEDPAVLEGDVVYDLALIKRLPAGQRFRLGDAIRFEVLVANHGNVPSGAYTVQDVLPAGLSFVSASDGATAAGGIVTWTGLPSLAPGEQTLLTVDVRMDDRSQPSYVNVAEITDDSSETYSGPGDPVTDRDSTPDGDPDNDPYADTDDVSTTPSGDEDDHDRALIDPAQVAVDNLSPVPPTPPTAPPTTVPVPGELPRTGGNSSNTALMAGGILLAGIALVLVRRRAPRRRAH